MSKIDDYNKQHVSLMVGYGYGKAVTKIGANRKTDEYINSLRGTKYFLAFISGYSQAISGQKLRIPNIPQFKK